jgi:arsenate reductase-like glutaredoxin family protein
VNLRHEVAKKKGWADKPPTVAELAREAAKEPNLLRRPILIRGKKVLVGFDKSNRDAWSKL